MLLEILCVVLTAVIICAIICFSWVKCCSYFIAGHDDEESNIRRTDDAILEMGLLDPADFKQLQSPSGGALSNSVGQQNRNMDLPIWMWNVPNRKGEMNPGI